MNVIEILWTVAAFIVGKVIVNGIVAHFLAKQIMKYATRWFSTTERKLAIWTHYQARALGSGHLNDSVLDCGQGKCAIF